MWRLEIAAKQALVCVRGLEEFETQGGGFCLYSREFYSSRLRIFLQK